MRTIRILVYDGPEEWMHTQRGKDLQTPYSITHVSGVARILSIEIDPNSILLTEDADSPTTGTLGIAQQIIKEIKLRKE